jgi:hypothetical protein
MRWLRLRLLFTVTFGLFVLFLLGLLLVGHAQANDERADHGEPPQGLWSYAASADFGQAVAENWESEFLQMGMYVLLTAHLLQKGSAESRPLGGQAEADFEGDEDPRLHRDDPDAPWPVRRGSPLVLRLYENSLAIMFFVLFALSVWFHAITGAAKYSEEQLLHGGEPVGTVAYLGTSEFWFESLQNWQSEFLAVAVIVIGSIWLRQRASPESKPVHAPHSRTGA